MMFAVSFTVPGIQESGRQTRGNSNFDSMTDWKEILKAKVQFLRLAIPA